MKLITLVLLFLSGSLAQRKFLQSNKADLEAPPQRPTGRGSARFIKTEEFQQVSNDYEKASRSERLRTNQDTPRQPQNRRPSKVITEDKFEITNSQVRPQLFEPVQQYSKTKVESKSEAPVKFESFETTSEAKIISDITESLAEISKEPSEISSSTTSTTTTTSTVKTTTRNSVGRTRGRNVGPKTITSATAIPSRTRGQRKLASRQNVGGVETISEPPRTNFRVGRRRPIDQNNLKGRGPSVIEAAEIPTRSRNERTANPTPLIHKADTTLPSRNERNTNNNKTETPIPSRNERANPNSRRRLSSSSTTTAPNSSTKSDIKRVREKRPEISTESGSVLNVRSSRRNSAVRSEASTTTTASPKSGRGRARSRFAETPKSQSTTETPSSTLRTTIRNRESRQRHTIPKNDEELASSSTVENPIRILAPTSLETVTQKIESRMDTLKPNEIQISDLDAQKSKQRIKETVMSEVSEVVSSRKVTRRRKAKASTRDQNNNAPTKIKLDVDLPVDEDDIDNLNYPPQYKALLAAKAKGGNTKVKKVLLVKTNPNSISSNKKLRKEINDYSSSTTKAPNVISSTASVLLKSRQVSTSPSPSSSTFSIISSTTVSLSSSSPSTPSSSLNEYGSSSKPQTRPTRRRIIVSTKSSKKQEGRENRKSAITNEVVTKATVIKEIDVKTTVTKEPVTKAPRKTVERTTSSTTESLGKQKYHARFREGSTKENEKKTTPSFTKANTGSRNTRKYGKTIEESRSSRNNVSSTGNVTQAPTIQQAKKSNRYSSRYRGETRDSPIRASTFSPVYTPTIPAVTSYYQKRGNGRTHTEEKDGYQIITIDDPSNLLYSDNLVDEKMADKTVETETKSSSIFERIINSITSISTTSKPIPQKVKPITESTAILKITTKKPNPDSIEFNTIPKDASTDKPTTVIERILNSLSAIQATDHVGTSSNTSNVSNNNVSSTIAKANGGSTFGDLFNLLGLAQTKKGDAITNTPLENEITSTIPTPLSSTTRSPKGTVAISLSDYLALLNKDKVIPQITTEDPLENVIDFGTTYSNFIPITTEFFPTTNHFLTTTTLPTIDEGFELTTRSPNFITTNGIAFPSDFSLQSKGTTEFISSNEFNFPTSTVFNSIDEVSDFVVTEPDTTTNGGVVKTTIENDLGTSTKTTGSTEDPKNTTETLDNTLSTMVTTDNSRSTKITTDDSASTIVTTDNSRGTMVTTDNSASTMVTTDNSRGTMVTTDNSASTMVTTDNSRGTMVTTDNSASTMVTTESKLTSELPEVTATTENIENITDTTTFKVSLNSVTITSSNDMNKNEDDANAVTIISKGSFSTNSTNQRNKSARLLFRNQDRNINNKINQPSTTPKSSDYFIFGVLPNNTIVRKRAPKKINAPYIIVGLYPNNTIVRKFPNGSIVPDEAVVQVSGFDTRDPLPYPTAITNQVTEQGMDNSREDRKLADLDINQLSNDVDANVKDSAQNLSEVSVGEKPTDETTTNLSTLTSLLGRKLSREFENILNKTLDGTTSNTNTLSTNTEQSTLENDVLADVRTTTKRNRGKPITTTSRTIPPRTTKMETTTNTIPPSTTTEYTTSTETIPQTTSYTTTSSSFLTTFLSTLRPVYYPTSTPAEFATRSTTEFFLPTTETELWNNLLEETTPGIVTITARRKTTPEPTSLAPITIKSKRNNSRRRTTTVISTTEEATDRIMTMNPVVTYITTVNHRRRTTVPTTTAPTTTAPPTTTVPTTTLRTTTTEKITTTLDPKNVNIDDLLKNTKKPLTDQQRQDLEVLKTLEKQQADLLQQLAFLTNFNIGGRQSESTPKRSSESSNLANRVLNFAIDRNKETTTQAKVETTTILPDPGRKVILSDTKITTIDELLKEINLNESQDNPALSTYGKSQEALIAALLKERGIKPSTPKTLRDKIEKNNIFSTEFPTTSLPTTTRRPKTTTERSGRLMQGLNWLLNALGPPPTTKRAKSKPKATKPRVLATTTELEDLWHEPTERQSTRVTTDRPTSGRKPVNSLTQEELQRLLAQLEEIQQDPNKAKNLDLKPLKNLAGTTTQRILENKHVEISSSGHSGSKKVTRAPKAQYETETTQNTRRGKSNKVKPVTVSNSIQDDDDEEEVVSKPTRSAGKSRPTLPPVELDPVPGVSEDSPVIGGRFLSAAVNVTRALSTFLGSAIQGAAHSFQSMIGAGSRGVGRVFASSSSREE